ncbi:MAG: hypothetical protein KJ593_00450 [Candidatus Omnitrophica bacterium]|nr:hypothetical protein [Candidatus Omnitrophota bacterium]
MKGLTLVELMIVSLILVVAIVALLVVFINALNQIALTKEINIATDDLTDVLERIKTTAFVDLTTQFPDGAVINSTLIGGFLLQDEAIVVRYPQGTNVDPLEIEVELTWTSKDSRARSQIFKTLRTQML